MQVLDEMPLSFFLSVASLLLLGLIGLKSGPAFAGWTVLGETDSGTRVYVDRSTILSKGNVVKMWISYDYRSMRVVAGKSYYSSKMQDEYDCAQSRLRTLAD